MAIALFAVFLEEGVFNLLYLLYSQKGRTGAFAGATGAFEKLQLSIIFRNLN